MTSIMSWVAKGTALAVNGWDQWQPLLLLYLNLTGSRGKPFPFSEAGSSHLESDQPEA